MANMLMLGYACQLGQLPVGAGSLRRAIELNGQAVAANQVAFKVGHLTVIKHTGVEALGRPTTAITDLDRARQERMGGPASLVEILDRQFNSFRTKTRPTARRLPASGWPRSNGSNARSWELLRRSGPDGSPLLLQGVGV